MTERRPILLLVNPESGRKVVAPAREADQEALEPGALLAGLVTRGLSAELQLLEEHDDAAALAARAASAGRDVVVAGGDGTVAPVAAALSHADATLGIVPTGSWNNVAAACGVPTELEAALDAIARGHTSRIDAGLAWHPAEGAAGSDDDPPPPDATRFFEAAGVGLDAAAFGATQVGERRGWLAAGRLAWRALRRRRTRMRLNVDGRRLRTAAPAVTVFNGPYMGIGLAVAPEADPTDGKLNVIVFSGMTTLDVLRHYLSVAGRRPQREPRTSRLEARRITISGIRRVLPAHADGQSIGTTPVTFAVDPGALRVFR
ncbi:MAG TPA: diacylglycerol kinase family protein [Candidatus Limnocylindria bacterium]|nr:diacylglycerol kinase family protein [Candidatus Limnocylindria bacterium]